MPLLRKPENARDAGRYAFRRSTLAACARDQRGAVLPIMAAMVLMAAGGAALAVDIGRAYAVKSDLQSAADSAALAAAIMLPDVQAARKAAQRAVDRSLPSLNIALTSQDLDFGHWNASNHALDVENGGASAVRVIVQLSEDRGNALQTLFAGVFGDAVMDIATSATAGKSGISCLIALDKKGKGLETDGNTELRLRACSVQVNSTGKEALKVSGKSSLVSDGFCLSGGAKIGSEASVSPSPSEYCPPQADPLADFMVPPIGACTDDHLEIKDETVTLAPGRVFCGGLKLVGKARVILEPGLYVIDNGKFELKDDAVLEGDGVTIILHDEKAELDIKDKASLRLTAPTEGPMKGLVIVQNDGAKKEKNNKWESNPS